MGEDSCLCPPPALLPFPSVASPIPISVSLFICNPYCLDHLVRQGYYYPYFFLCFLPPNFQLFYLYFYFVKVDSTCSFCSHHQSFSILSIKNPRLSVYIIFMMQLCSPWAKLRATWDHSSFSMVTMLFSSCLTQENASHTSIQWVFLSYSLLSPSRFC